MAKNEFRPNLLANLRQRVGEGGRPLDIKLELIDRDPDQPRKNFDDSELNALAETVRRYGILQPIMVRRSREQGRWIIVHGERRWRAAGVAGLTSIPAFEDRSDGAVRAAQVIENQHRAGLANSELASVIDELTREKLKDEDLATIVGLPKQQLKHYRALLRLPETLKVWTDVLDARTVYELLLAWEKADETGRHVIETRMAALNPSGGLSVTDARRIIRSIEDGKSPVDSAITVPGAGVIGQRLGYRQEVTRLRELVDRLVTALESAAERLKESHEEEAAHLRREAAAAKDETRERVKSTESGGGEGGRTDDERAPVSH